MSNDSFLNRIHSKTPSLATLLLLFKHSTSKNPLLIYIAVFLKLFGLILMSSNFVYSNDYQKKYQLRGTYLLRSITLFNILLKRISFSFYYVLCVLVYFLEIGFFVYIILLISKIRRRKYSDLSINRFGRFCFYFNLLFSQHVLELLGFIIFPFVYDKIIISNDLYDDDYSSIPMLSLTSVRYFNLVYLIPNAFVYIFVNLVLYYSFYVLNSPIFNEDSPMRYRHLSQSFFSILCQVIYSFHYYEIFVSGMALTFLVIKVIVQVLVTIPIIWYYFISLKNFEFNNWLGWMTKIMLLYSLSSGVLEIFISFGNYQLNFLTVVILFIIKLANATTFTWLYYYLKYKALLSISSVSLFSLSQDSWPNDYVESYAFLIDKLNSILIISNHDEGNDRNIKDLVNVILGHEKKCSNANCECKILKVFPHSTSKSNDFKTIICKRIGFLIETTFIRCEIITKFNITLLLSQYYSICKNNSFMAYSILQSFIAVNWNKMSFFQFIDFYSLQLYFINNCKEIYQKHDKYVRFSALFIETNNKKKLKKLLLKYCENFIQLVNIKEAIETSVKFDYDYNGELREISSKYLTRVIINKIVNLVLVQGKLHQKIHHTFVTQKMNSSKMEYYYQMFLFCSLFSQTIEKSVHIAFNHLNVNDNFHLKEDELMYKFDKYLAKYFSKNKKDYYIMIKCNKGFTIQYFSSELIKILKFNQTSLIGEPLSSLFPVNFGELHRKAMIRELNKANFFFKSKSSYIFDSSGYSYPCKLNSAFMPHLSKCLIIISKVVMKTSVVEANQSFILDRYFTLLSISKNLESKFALSLELVKKCDIDILEIFEVSRNFLQKTFSSYNSKIEKINKYLQGDTSEIFSRWLFIPKIILDESMDVMIKKAKLEQCAKSMKKPIKTAPKESKVIERKRLAVLQNIVKTLTRYTEIDLQDDTFKKFTESFYQFQSRYSASSLNNGKGLIGLDQLVYNINIEAKCLYNTTLYYFSFQLQQDAMKTPDPLPEPKKKYTQNTLKDHSYTIPVTINSNQDPQTKVITINIPIKDKQIPDLNPRDKHSNENRLIWKEIKHAQLTRYFFIFSNLVGILLTVLIIIFNMQSFKSIKSILLTIDSNNYQRDALNQVYSTYLSLISHLSGVSENEYSIETYRNLSKDTLYLFQDSFKLFYSMYMKYCIHFGKDSNKLEQLNPYISILHDWNNYTYESDYSSEINKMTYLGMKTVNEPFDMSLIRPDLALFFQKEYLNTPNSPVQSSLGLFSFYIVNNLQNIYLLVHAKLFKSFDQESLYYLNNYTNLILVFEIFIFFYYTSFFVVFYLLIRRVNNNLFVMIVEMFLYSGTNKRDSLKNTTGNLLLSQKIHMFCEIIKNFNEDNCLEFRKKQKEKATTIMEDQIGNTAQTIVTTGNITNNSTLNYLSSNNLISKQNPTLLKKLNHRNDNISLKTSNNKSNNNKEENNIWSSKKFTKYFKIKNVWVLLIFKLLTFSSILFCILFSLFRILNSFDYVRKMKLIQVNLDILTGKYTLLINIFNEIRVSLLSDINNFHHINDFNIFVLDILNNNKIINDLSRYFPISGELQHQTTLKINDTNFKINIICEEDEKCIEAIQMKNNYCADGIQFGIETILQKYVQIINDFKSKNDSSITRIEIIEYFRKNNMGNLEKTVDFVLLKVQRIIYNSFRQDSTNLGMSSEKYIYLWTFITMTITFLIMIWFILMVYLHIYKKYNYFSKEVSKINHSLFHYSIK